MRKMHMIFALPLLFTVCFFGVAKAQSIGFGNNEFSINPISGSIQVNCTEADQSLTEVYDCQDDRLSPFDMAFFQGPNAVTADQLYVTIRREDNTLRDKVTGYDNQNFTSDVRLNLWLTSLLQRPLLAEGRNQVTYKISKFGVTVGSGQLVVNVNPGKALSCPFHNYYSNKIVDCQNPYQLCQRYFNEFNYCR